MGMIDEAKDKLKKAKDVAVNKAHEQKGRLEERHDQKTEKKWHDEYVPYEPEEKDV